MLWATASTIKHMICYLQTHNLMIFLQQVFKWFTIGAKSMVLIFLWVRILTKTIKNLKKIYMYV